MTNQNLTDVNEDTLKTIVDYLIDTCILYRLSSALKPLLEVLGEYIKKINQTLPRTWNKLKDAYEGNSKTSRDAEVTVHPFSHITSSKLIISDAEKQSVSYQILKIACENGPCIPELIEYILAKLNTIDIPGTNTKLIKLSKLYGLSLNLTSAESHRMTEYYKVLERIRCLNVVSFIDVVYNVQENCSNEINTMNRHHFK